MTLGLEQTSERDYRGLLNIVKFIQDNNTDSSRQLVPEKTVKEISRLLVGLYQKIAYKMQPSSTEYFITLMRNNVFADSTIPENVRMQDKIAEITIKFIKHEASDIKYLCNGLEVFELLGILKNEERKALLLKLKQAL